MKSLIELPDFILENYDIVERNGIRSWISRKTGIVAQASDIKKALDNYVGLVVDLNMNRLRTILEATQEASGATMEELLSSSRKRNLVRFRQIFCYIAAKDLSCNASQTTIGDMINRDRTTFLHAVQTIADLLATQDEFTIDSFHAVKEVLKNKEV